MYRQSMYVMSSLDITRTRDGFCSIHSMLVAMKSRRACRRNYIMPAGSCRWRQRKRKGHASVARCSTNKARVGTRTSLVLNEPG